VASEGTRKRSKSNSFAQKRRDSIVQYINSAQHAGVTELAEMFGVSISSIRNDLNYLAEKNLINRFHGGASSIGNTRFSFDTNIYERSDSNAELKNAIALESVKLIEDGDTIAVLAGTTLFALSKLLVKKNDLTIVVNDIQIASWLNENTNHRVFVLGGFIRHQFHYITFDTACIQCINVDKAFFSTTAFDFERGAMVPDINLATSQRNILERSNQVVILCDSTKLHKIAFAQLARVEDIDYFIVDNNITAEDREKFSTLSDIKLIVAGE